MFENSWFLIYLPVIFIISITEPKIKLYFSVIGNSIKDGKEKLHKLRRRVEGMVEKILSKGL